ncbi:uncharacterized protein LOC107861760 [Capsicum annuum]|uniref:uncharacterized protein LOC107861760 n=1 Tax=Capsicum annuum TaxID=4072 RepID=UPI001FB165CC|nr:uncharacterized protein LOC107861760 [Capsicum annuum]
MDELRQAQEEKVQEALDMGEIETSKGLNQELGLARVDNTRWGSHYKSFKNFISMFGSITDVLDTTVVDSESVEEKARATGYLRTCQTFEVSFILHLLRDILAITNNLNESLQKKEQDIANAFLLVKVVKKQLQDLRDEGWDPLIKSVTEFCVRLADYTISHHYDVEVFFKIIDWQLQELNGRFNEVRTNLLFGVAWLNPVDSFSNFDINKILRMVELYPDDFGLGDLFEELVKTKKYFNYPLVFRLVKFALLLLVATTTVERTFSVMKLIKRSTQGQHCPNTSNIHFFTSQHKATICSDPPTVHVFAAPPPPEAPTFEVYP